MEDENKIAETTENTTAVAEPAQAAPAPTPAANRLRCTAAVPDANATTSFEEDR